MEIKYDFLSMKPIAFFPYSHLVMDLILSGRKNDSEYDELKRLLLKSFKEAGIESRDDNKIVFGLVSNSGPVIYVGFYDNGIRVGFSVKKIC